MIRNLSNIIDIRIEINSLKFLLIPFLKVIFNTYNIHHINLNLF